MRRLRKAGDQRDQERVDRELLNNIRPEFPLDTRTEMHCRADRMTVEYRKILAELARENSDITPDSAWARPFVNPDKQKTTA